ncbi:LacI family DNA-binding transcriptional regulator [Paraburkholderia gardini]|jgi:DNA-binding LacI/PurR family transcriptional regulator|uniref:HTH-type transcriptional regulator DegA n=1 Tax=Paraburkholderia gardini TaxID=2823469 RepID=A0ABM8U6V8_9BURK|nr:LacI family DNA-binding transcriptional regulator [Paraburkholderia gardini]CAG4910249.1 HTH-type transcriptional regulator DegA [Paraburkholderia gardini]
MTTLNEVAAHAGVTPATVSNVLRNRGRVGAATRERVLHAVKELGYRPHLAARALAEGRAPTFALMVSSIANPFYPEFTLAAERAARTSGHFLIVCNTNDDQETGRAYLEQIAGTLSEGVLVTNAELVFDDLRATAERGTPVVLCMWERPDDPPGLPCVAVDFRLAGALAAQHLLDLGHTRVGALVGSKSSHDDQSPFGIHGARRDGFVERFNAAGNARIVAEFICEADTIRGGYDAARQLLKAHPEVTALYATNDLPALGAMHAAADMGLSVPDDLSVVGITDIQLARESRPALSTVAVPTEEAARMAVDLLRELIDRAPRASRGNPDTTGTPPMRVTSAPVMVPRASTAPPRTPDQRTRSSLRKR